MGLTQNLGRISTGLTADASLNIGVGVTPSGTYRFEVGTTSKFTGVATFGSTLSNGTYTYTLPSATGTLALTSSLSGYLPLTAGSGNKLTGDLYINKTNSSLVFQGNTIDGIIYNTGSNLFLQDNATGTKGLTLNLSTGAATFSSSVQGGNLFFGSYNSSSAGSIWATDYGTPTVANYVAYFATGGSIINSYSGITSLRTAGIDRLYILNTGNIGIRTLTPQSPLEVSGGSSYFPAKIITLSGAEATRYSGNIGLNLIGGSQLAMSFGTRSNNIDYDNTLNLYNGNVGIGTASPASLLTVNGTSANTESGQIKIIKTGANEQTLHIGYNTTSDYAYLNAYKAGLGYKPIALNPDGGNVLIGTATDAGYKLDVNGTGRFTSTLLASGAITGQSNANTFGTASATGRAVIIQAGSTNQAIMFKNAAGGDGTLFINGTSTSIDYNFNTYSVGDAFVIKNSGNVGIGTASPSKQFTVRSLDNNVTTFAGFYALNETQGTEIWYGGIQMGGSNANVDLNLSSKAAANIIFNTNATERMRLGSDGVFYYGTTIYNSALKGILFNPNGYSFFTIDGNTVAVGTSAIHINRLNNDGKLLSFQKNTSETGYISTNTYSLPSDFNFKKNINNLDLGLNLINKLRPISYNHKIDDKGAALSTGFIAQEMEQSLTELGIEENAYFILQHKEIEDKTQSQYWIDYTKMIPVLVKAIQEQQQQIKELQSQINK